MSTTPPPNSTRAAKSIQQSQRSMMSNIVGAMAALNAFEAAMKGLKGPLNQMKQAFKSVSFSFKDVKKVAKTIGSAVLKKFNAYRDVWKKITFQTKTLGQLFGTTGLTGKYKRYNKTLQRHIRSVQQLSKNLKGIPLKGGISPKTTAQFREMSPAEFLKGKFQKGISAIKDQFTKIGDFFIHLASSIDKYRKVGTFDPAGHFKKGQFDIGKIGADLKDAFSNAGQNLGQKMEKAFVQPGKKLTETREEIKALEDLQGLATMRKKYGATVSPEAEAQVETQLKQAKRKEKVLVAGETGKGMLAKSFAAPAKAVTGIVGGMAKLTALPFKAVGKVAGGMGKMFGRMIGLKPKQMTAIGGAFKSMTGGLPGIAMGFLVDVLMRLLDAVNPLKPVVEALTEIFGVWGEILGQAFTPLIEALFDILLSDAALSGLESIAMAFAEVVIAFLPLLDILLPIGELLMNAFLIPLQLLTPLIAGLGEFLGPLMEPFEDLLGIFAELILTIGIALMPLFEALGAILVALAPILTPLITIFADLVVMLLDVVLVGIQYMFQGIFWLINGVIELINLIPGVDLPLFEIPTFGDGGYVTEPTLAIVGESGPEYMIPESRMGEVAGGGGTTIIINGPVSGRTLEELDTRMWIQQVTRRNAREMRYY